MGDVKNKDFSSGVKKVSMQYMGQIIFLVAMFVYLSFATPTFFTGMNLINVSRQISTNMIVSCAMTMILITAGIDLSVVGGNQTERHKYTIRANDSHQSAWLKNPFVISIFHYLMNL